MQYICWFTSFSFLFIPYTIPCSAWDFARMSCFGSYWHFPECGFILSGMLMALPITVGTSPRGITRTLAYGAVSSSFGRGLGYPVPSLETWVPLKVPGHAGISSHDILQKGKYSRCDAWWGCTEPLAAVYYVSSRWNGCGYGLRSCIVAPTNTLLVSIMMYWYASLHDDVLYIPLL